MDILDASTPVPSTPDRQRFKCLGCGREGLRSALEHHVEGGERCPHCKSNKFIHFKGPDGPEVEP